MEAPLVDLIEMAIRQHADENDSLKEGLIYMAPFGAKQDEGLILRFIDLETGKFDREYRITVERTK